METSNKSFFEVVHPDTKQIIHNKIQDNKL